MDSNQRSQLLNRLTGKIANPDYERIVKFYPVTDSCPTCDDTGRYRCNGEVHECDCEIQKLLQRHYFAANIGREYHDIGLQHFVGDDANVVIPRVQEYISRFDDNFHYGLGITFSGPVGTGKTMAVCCILKELVQQGRRVYFITFEDMIAAWSKAYMDDDYKLLMNKLMSVEVLGLDELRVDPRNRTGFLANGLDVVMRHRTSNLLPTIITTNLLPDEEGDQFGKAYSLLSARNERILFTGRDIRGTTVRQWNHELRDKGERRPIC
jgi:DNA replication protein DnaC